ncbi:MAG: polysulfide reductase NrfD, partial [Acidobacteriota bacterium]
VAAAMASGTALMIITIVILFRMTNRHVDDALILWLGRFLAIILLVVLYFLFMENAYRVYVVELREAAIYYLFGGLHSILFWIGLILIGCGIPMFILFRKKTGNSVRWVLIASILVVFGILCERYVIVLPGLMHPPEMFPGMLVTGTGAPEGYVAYSMGFVEILQAMGVFGVIGFLFVWGLKVFKLLPHEAKALI